MFVAFTGTDGTKALDVKNVYADVKCSNVYTVDGFMKIDLLLNGINNMCTHFFKFIYLFLWI